MKQSKSKTGWETQRKRKRSNLEDKWCRIPNKFLFILRDFANFCEVLH